MEAIKKSYHVLSEMYPLINNLENSDSDDDSDDESSEIQADNTPDNNKIIHDILYNIVSTIEDDYNPEILTNIESNQSYNLDTLFISDRISDIDMESDINTESEVNTEDNTSSNNDSEHLEEINLQEMYDSDDVHSNESNNSDYMDTDNSDDSDGNEFFSYIQNIHSLYSEHTPLLQENGQPNIIIPYNNIPTFIGLQYVQSSIISVPIIHENDDNGEWLCNKCGIINHLENKCCDKDLSWNCSECTTSNKYYLIKCTECNELRKWTCDVCQNINPITSHTCRNCLITNSNLMNYTCSECNETKQLKNKYYCSDCGEARECQCSHCITNMIFIPFMFNDLMESDNDIDFTELEDVEVDNGLKQEQLDNIEKIKWNNTLECEQCMICINKYDENETIYQLPCNKLHCFHTCCLNKWFEKHNTCPICRHIIE